MSSADSIFEDVKAAVTVPDYLLSRGIEPNRQRKICCPWHEEKTPSGHVYADAVHCFGCGRRGDVCDVAAVVEGFATPHDAASELARRYGITTRAAGRARKSPTRSRSYARDEVSRKSDVAEKLPAMPAQAMSAWNEGVDHLEGKPELVEMLASFRGWPVGFARYLVECASISMPLYHGARAIAFLVEAPEALNHPLEGKLAMRDVGYHCRLKPQEGSRAGWRFVPNESEHGQRTSALPFIIGGSWFDSARLLIVTEGQWDALSFALAAGWLGEGCRWPENVCVIGIRGASGINSFLDAYSHFWPEGANCLLLPDTDGAGSKWFDGKDSFADRLAQLCTKVAVEGCGEHKDFNDLYRAERVTPDQVEELLASHGMNGESGGAA